MTDLVEFLRARFNEDREDAERGYLKAPEIPDYDGWNGGTTAGLPPAVILRVLAEIDAKDAIVVAHPITTSVVSPGYGERVADFGCETCHDWDGVTEGCGYCATLRLLAAPYAAHHDYRTEWAPGVRAA